MPGIHAKLSASSATRWMACPPSVALNELFEETTSQYAEEGTKAHDVAEKKLRKYIARGRKNIKCTDADMDRYTDDYRDYVVDQFNAAKKQDSSATLLVEEKLDFSEWVPEGFGTGDAVIIANGTCHIIDLKYGKGVEVSAVNNPQCRLYALGAISVYDMIYDFNKVKVHIFQPRLNNISIEELEVEELLAWGNDVVLPAAKLADAGEGEFNPGENQCKFCKAKATCKARADAMIDAYKEVEDTDPRLLDQQRISEALGYIKNMEAWCKELKAYALDQMLQGINYDGYKLVEGRANRVIINEDEMVAELHSAGFTDNDIKQLKSLTELEELVGKKQFEIIGAGLIEKPKGKPTIAPITDRRPVYQKVDVEEAFKDVEVC